jgi:hypothetical protein
MAKNDLARAGSAHALQFIDPSDPKSARKARRQMATDPQKLDKRRKKYQDEGMELRAIIEHMQKIRVESIELNKALRELQKRADKLGTAVAGTKEYEEVHGALEKMHAQIADREALYQDCYNMASLRGLNLLFEGLALVTDMLSIQEREGTDRKTDETEYARYSITDLFDEFAEGIFTKMNRLTRMVNDLGISQNLWHKGKYIRVEGGQEVEEDDDRAAEPSEPVELENPVPAGVPEEDLKVAQLSREKVVQFARGEQANETK